MKNYILIILLSVITVGDLFSQIGNGVTMTLNNGFSIGPVSVNDTAFIDVTISNSVNASQDVIFTISNDTASQLGYCFMHENIVNIGPLSDTTLRIFFTSNETGYFWFNLSWNASIFGGGETFITAESTQAILSLDTDVIYLGSYSLGQTVISSFDIYNNGTGTLLISNISSSNEFFELDSVFLSSYDISNISISQNESLMVTFSYSATSSGNHSAIFSIESNDDDNPLTNVSVYATSVSNIQGELCSESLTLNLENSPYTLIGDVSIPSSCNLTIEGGVQIDGQGQYDFIVDGKIDTYNNENDSIYFTNIENLEIRDSLYSLNRFSFNQINRLSFTDIDSLSNSYVHSENLYIGNDFSLNNFHPKLGYQPSGWSVDYTFGSYNPYSASEYISIYSYHDQNSYGVNRLRTNNYTVTSEDIHLTFTYRPYRIEISGHFRVYYQINGLDWHEIFVQNQNDNNPDNNYYTITLSDESFNNVNIGDQISFIFEADNYNTTNNSYDEVDIHLRSFILGGVDGGSEKNSYIHNTKFLGESIYLNNTTQIKNSNINLDKSAYINSSLSCINSNFRTDSSAIISFNNNSLLDFYNCSITSIFHDGIKTNSNLNLKYSIISNCQASGIKFFGENEININSSMISYNGGIGINTSSKVNINYSNITFNGGIGIYLKGNNFSNIKNSIVWGNDISNYTQVQTNGGITSITYSSVQGLNAYGTLGQQYFYGDGAINDDPVFESEDQFLSSFSSCVDAGTPWENDAHMPYGLGGVRSDIGVYGGPDNWFWGGNPIPDGSALIVDIDDTPQDQGGIVGIIFNKSVWDDFDLVNRVTHYSFWRHYDVNGNSIDTISNGNWQLMGTMQSQGFNSYAYEVNTIGDSSIANGPFNSCFTVIAHTQDSSTFWYSNVLCGNSVDNLSPVSTDLIAEQTDPDQVLLAWNPSIDDDFAYSEIFSDFGFSQTNLTDTTTFDLTVEAGETVTYGLIHYDVNGNPSDTSWTTIQLQDDKDYIALKAGWNLISTNVTPDENNIPAIMSSLTPNNLIFITGFNNGVSVFDPNGLPFLNTLNQFEDGYGYWVKVNQDDTLIVSGELISHDFIPDFNAGWNLVGYTQGYSQPIETYFDFLLFDDNLIYATSFNQGVSVYDPNGLPFLNTLNTVDDNFGYWVKLNSAYGGSNSMRLSSDGQSYSPNFMLVNGTSNLTSQKGDFIEVLNSNDEVVAKLEILHDGYVMTSALYGDDKLTVDVDGLQQGELLRFKYKNSIIDNGLVFNGDMELRKLDLEFNLTDGILMYPNPTRGLSNIEFTLVESSDVILEICDVSGRVISSILTSYDGKGSYSLELDLQSFDSGAYFVKLIVNNQITYTDRIFKQ